MIDISNNDDCAISVTELDVALELTKIFYKCGTAAHGKEDEEGIFKTYEYFRDQIDKLENDYAEDYED